MNNFSKSLYRLSKVDVQKATITLVNAFHNDPFSKVFIPNQEVEKLHKSIINKPHWY
jgi:hypothetical protein